MPSPERIRCNTGQSAIVREEPRSRIRGVFHLELKKYNTQHMSVQFRRVNFP
jgi:hypothetical protein